MVCSSSPASWELPQGSNLGLLSVSFELPLCWVLNWLLTNTYLWVDSCTWAEMSVKQLIFIANTLCWAVRWSLLSMSSSGPYKVLGIMSLLTGWQLGVLKVGLESQVSLTSKLLVLSSMPQDADQRKGGSSLLALGFLSPPGWEALGTELGWAFDAKGSILPRLQGSWRS